MRREKRKSMIQNNHPSKQLTMLQKKVEGLERKVGELESRLSIPRPKEKLLNTAEACMYLDVGRTSLYRYMDGGLLSYTMVGKQRRFALQELDRFMDRDRKDALPSIL